MSVRGNWRAKFVFGAVSRGKSQLYYFLLLQPGSLFCVMVRLFPSHRAKDNLDYEVMRTASFVDNFLLQGSPNVSKESFSKGMCELVCHFLFETWIIRQKFGMGRLSSFCEKHWLIFVVRIAPSYYVRLFIWVKVSTDTILIVVPRHRVAL